MPRTSTSVAFSVREADQPRLDRLVKKFGGGNRSAFLRVAMDRMEAAGRPSDLHACRSTDGSDLLRPGCQAKMLPPS